MIKTSCDYIRKLNLSVRLPGCHLLGGCQGLLGADPVPQVAVVGLSQSAFQ